MLGPGNNLVITVEPVREETKGRQEEVRSAVKNTGSGLCEWVIEEAAWLFTQFTKVALSVAVVRGVHQLFRIGYASESAYQRAPDLWSHGYQDRGHQSASAGYDYRGGSAGSWQPRREGTAGGSAQTGGSSFDHAAGQTTPENPRYVTTVGGYHLYLHRKILNPGKQFWPCPVLYRSPCEICSFLEYDGGGRPQCVPLVKLKMVLDGNDGGEDLNEIRQWIRGS
jgi:hypothetical protein